jgi:hypothetical protein
MERNQPQETFIRAVAEVLDGCQMQARMTAETLLHPEEGFPDTQYTNGACSASYKIAPTTIEGSTPDPTKGAREEGILSLEGPYDRLLGDTEENWCRAIAGGTGITVLGVLFSQQLDPSLLQLAVDVVQVRNLFLYSCCSSQMQSWSGSFISDLRTMSRSLLVLDGIQCVPCSSITHGYGQSLCGSRESRPSEFPIAHV